MSVSALPNTRVHAVATIIMLSLHIQPFQQQKIISLAPLWTVFLDCIFEQVKFSTYREIGNGSFDLHFLSLFASPLMIMVQKITQVAFAVHDGKSVI